MSKTVQTTGLIVFWVIVVACWLISTPPKLSNEGFISLLAVCAWVLSWMLVEVFKLPDEEIEKFLDRGANRFFTFLGVSRRTELIILISLACVILVAGAVACWKVVVK